MLRPFLGLPCSDLLGGLQDGLLVEFEDGFLLVGVGVARIEAAEMLTRPSSIA